MNKIKSILKDSLNYIASRKLLKYSLIIILLLVLTGTILTNKFFNNKEVTKQELSELKDKKKDIAKGTIYTDAVAGQETSIYNLSDGYTEASKSGNLGSSNSSNSNNKVNSHSSTTVNTDKSSLSGRDLEVLEGHEFNPKKDLNLKATDKDGRNISENIIIEKNTVNTKTPGVYTVRASVRLSDGQKIEKEFTVTVKETHLDVVLEAFKPVKETAKKGENIVFDLDLKVSKNHITPTYAMIDGKEYPLYKGNENILYRLSNKKRYKVIVNANDIAGVKEYNLEHVKMSNGSWISLGENIANVEVLKEVASVKNFTYEEQSIYKRVKAKFNLEDIDNTASNLKLEFYKDKELVKTEMLDKKSEYEVYLPTTSNGKYDFKILADVNLTQGISKNNVSKEAIFTTTVSISNINQSSLIGKNAEIIQGDKFDPVKDLSLKATDFDGEDITDKIVLEGSDIDTNIVGKYSVSAYIINKKGKKYTNKFDVTVNPIGEVIEFNPVKDEFDLNENISFEVKLNMEKNGTEADKAIINGEKVNLVPKKLKNALNKIKVYSVEVNGELSAGEKSYLLSKIIMKDGKEFDSNKEINVNILEENNTTNSQDNQSLSRMLFNNEKQNKSVIRKSNDNDTITGSETAILNQKVTIHGSVKKADGSAPDGIIEVELPTAMAFSVDQDGKLTSGVYTVTNKSSVDITVSVASFSDYNPSGGITVRPKSESLDGLDRSNLHLSLVGGKNSVDLGEVITTPIKLLDVNSSGVGTIHLNGEAGTGNGNVVDKKGVSDKFSLVLSIKKKN